MINFQGLRPYKNREFIPDSIDFANLDEVKSVYDQLLNRNISSRQDLEKWLLNRSEFEAAFDQFGSILYIEMTCQTDNEFKAEAYTSFISRIVPEVKPLDDQLNQKFLVAYDQYGLEGDRYDVYVREIRADIELYRKENVPLQTKIDLLSQEYQKICGAMTVHFESKEQTMPEMSKYLLDTNRSKREGAWKAVGQRRLQDKDKLESLFDQMLKLRHQVALNAGFSNYGKYKFKSLHRFDYTVEDCKAYHRAVEKVLLPVAKEILCKRKEQMALDKMRPWDTAVDPLGREPLQPFQKVEDLIEGCTKIFSTVDTELGENFSQMAEKGLLDLASRKGKAPGGYQSALNDSRVPFIFMNAVGVDGDVRTLLHEGGHSFHTWAVVEEPLLDYRHGPMEFCEVASMAMELLGGEYMDIFYCPEDANRSVVQHLEDIISVLIWVATIDAFQHWIYENPQHTQGQRKEAWMAICERFSSDVIDWSGFEEEHAFMWHRQLHIFEVPFYYIEYAIAQLGALQVWANYKKDKVQAIQSYKKALSLGGARPLSELFQKAGITFDFTEETIRPLIEMVNSELKKLNF